MRVRVLLLFCGAVCLAGCAVGPSPEAVDDSRVRQELATLSGARTDRGEGLSVSYPGETLFAEGSALPLAGGKTVLEPLAALLARHPEVRWVGIVRASADLPLAEKRAEILERYLGRKGISAERLKLVPEATEGPPLEIGPAPPQPASSVRSPRPKS